MLKTTPTLSPNQYRRLLPRLPSARRVVREAWRRGVSTDPKLPPSQWCEQHRFVAEGTSPHPGKWENKRAPFLKEIADCMAPDHPARRVTFAKSAQIAGSELISNVLGWIIDVAPGPTLVVHPTIEAGRDWTQEKFEPTVQATPALRRKISNAKVRDRSGSTLKRKRFPGGSIVITGANSPAGLRQKSVRYLIFDDFDEFPLSIGSQGDPARMGRARLISFTKSGQDKELDVSTPTNRATSRIWAQFEAGDRRRYHVKCPQCGHLQTLKWGGPDKPFGLKFNREAPHRAHYLCESGNGCVIERWQLEDMLQPENGASWIAEMPGPGREPSFHINALYSPFTTWDAMVAAFVEAEGDPEKLRTFINLWLGEVWDEAGDTPKVDALLARRMLDWVAGTLPAGALIVTLSGDVQGDGIYYKFLGFGRDRQMWCLEHGFLPGDPTSGASAVVWADLAQLTRKTFRDPLDNDVGVDAVGIDANYATDVVVEWCRKAPGRYPLRGEEGHHVPPWSGRSTAREFSERGRKRRRGAKTFPVGTWQLKERFYGQLKIEPTVPAKPGTIHFGQWADQPLLEQLTSEVFVRRADRKTGRIRTGWHALGENHYLDAVIYGMAMAEKCGLSKNGPRDWDWLERQRQRRADAPQASLFDTVPIVSEDPMPVANAVRAPEPQVLGWGDNTIDLG